MARLGRMVFSKVLPAEHPTKQNYFTRRCVDAVVIVIVNFKVASATVMYRAQRSAKSAWTIHFIKSIENAGHVALLNEFRFMPAEDAEQLC